ncbi:MAG: hypothetical protein U0768_16490 [Anaerolineae bacterium]
MATQPPGEPPGEKPIVVPSRPPTPEQQKIADDAAASWRKVQNDAPVEAIKRIEDAAKQLITLTGALQGITFAVFAFGNVKDRISGLWLLPFVVPVLLWLVSMMLATFVFVPRPRDADLNDYSPAAWLRLRDAYQRVSREKLRWLHFSQAVLILSFLTVVVLVLFLAVVPSAPPPAPTRIILVTPTP